MSVIKYYINLLKIVLTRINFNLKNFGIKIAFLNFLSDISLFYLIKNYKFSIKIRQKQEENTIKLLKKKYSNIIEEYKTKNVPVGFNCKKIWCFWAQGIENAPQVVKNCVNSIDKNKGDYELVLLNQNNYTDYVSLPEQINKKVASGTISLTHLSDILRSKLLSTYGGVWVDSTMFFCDNIFKEFDDIEFNTRFAKGEVKWGIYLMGGKPNKLFSFIYDSLIAYYSEYDELINYFLMDLMMHIAYDSFDECRKYIDNATIEQPNVLYFIERFSKPFDKEEYSEITKKDKFFKLTYKNSANSRAYDKNGNITYYGYFTKEL